VAVDEPGCQSENKLAKRAIDNRVESGRYEGSGASDAHLLGMLVVAAELE
jgi:hypothetical protein